MSEIISGGWTGPATEPAFNEIFETHIHLDTNGSVALFRQYLQAGQTYQIMCETSVTGYDRFYVRNISLLYWKPSDWPGSLVYPFSPTYEDSTNVDVVPPQPDSLPYNFRLSTVDGIGGRRATIVADETGDWYFCFYRPKLIVDFTGDPLSGSAPLSVWFYRTYTPGLWWGSLTWDLGDGNFVYDDEAFHHEYTDPGIYTVSLTEETEGDTAIEVKPNYIIVT